MKIFLSIAWRNVMRNKKRSMITIFAIAFGLMMLIFMWSIYDGLSPLMINNMTNTFMGHMQISTPEFVDKPDLDSAIFDGDKIIEIVNGEEGIAAYSPRLQTFGLINYADNSVGASITGIDPELESSLGRMDESVMEGGTFLAGEDRNGVVIGVTMAKNLDVGLNDEILIVTSNRFNSLSYMGPLRVVGLLQSQVPEIDANMVFIDRKILSKELYIDSGVEYTNPDAEITDTSGIMTQLAIRLDRGNDLESVYNSIKEQLPEGTIIRDYNEIVPWVQQSMQMREAFGYIVIAIVMIIVVAGILNTVLMSVMERTREFGIMRALGTKSRQIFATICMESIFLGLVGLIAGTLGGVLLVLVTGYYGLDIYATLDKELLGQFYMFDTIVYPALKLESLLNTCGIILVSIIIVSLYPARKAARMEPINAIKSLG